MILRLAFRNIFRNRRRSLFTGLSMLAGYMLLVISLSIQDGSYHWVLKSYTQGQSGHIQILHSDFLQKPSLYKTVPVEGDWLTRLQDLPSVQFIRQRIDAAALAYGEHKGATALIQGIEPSKEDKLRSLSENIKTGNYFALEYEPNQVIIGATLAKQLQLSIGSDLVLISQGIDGSMANDVYSVIGIIGDQKDAFSNTIFMRLSDVQAFLYMPNRVHRILINTDAYRDSVIHAQALNQWLEHHGGSEEIQAFAWQDVEKEFYRTMSADKAGNQLGIYILVFLICLGVLNTVLMSLLERKGEYGVLKAIGASRGYLFATIITEAQILCLMCCVLGFILVLPINYYFYAVGVTLEQPMDVSGITLTALRGIFDPYIFYYPLGLLMGSTFLLTLIPAWRAASVKPLQGMQAL